jgi:hypothetical protein
MISFDNGQTDLFDPSAGWSNYPSTPLPNRRWLRSTHEVLTRREVRRWSDFQLENMDFGLRTRSWFWLSDLDLLQSIAAEQRRRKCAARRSEGR